MDGKFQYFENTGKTTVVLGTKHPNISVWLFPAITLKLTEKEAEESGVASVKGIEIVKDAKKIKLAMRPGDAQRAIIKNKFKSEEEKKAEKKKDEEKDPGGFNTRPAVKPWPPVQKREPLVNRVNRDPETE